MTQAKYATNSVTSKEERITRKWKTTGLLQNLSETIDEETGFSEQMECAVLLENTASALLGLYPKDTNADYDRRLFNCAFPLVRILFGDGLRFCHRNFLTKFENWLKENPEIKEDEKIIDEFVVFFKN